MTRLRRLVRHLIGSAALYPITALYLAAVLLLWLAMMRQLSVAAAVIILGLVAALAVGWSAYREARSLRRLFESQRAELLEHIDDLASAARVAVPEERRREQEGRDEVRQVPEGAGRFQRG